MIDIGELVKRIIKYRNPKMAIKIVIKREEP